MRIAEVQRKDPVKPKPSPDHLKFGGVGERRHEKTEIDSVGYDIVAECYLHRGSHRQIVETKGMPQHAQKIQMNRHCRTKATVGIPMCIIMTPINATLGEAARGG